jgi:phosphoesterase RecJ-like protein
MAVDKVKAVFVVRQDTDKTCTAGFRSKDDLDVSIVAAKFGGGGHKNASGASYTGNIRDFIEKILIEMSKIIS